VQEDTDMTQALDMWIQRLDTLQKEKENATKTEEQLEAEAKKASRRRDNLLKPRGLK
jgi:hypothetical protein